MPVGLKFLNNLIPNAIMGSALRARAPQAARELLPGTPIKKRDKMNFQPLTLREIGAFRPLFQKLTSRTCDYTVGSMFMWRDFFHIEYALEKGALFSRLRIEEGNGHYYLPVSDDVEGALQRLIGERTEEEPLRFWTIPEEYVPLFTRTGRVVSITEQPDLFDYLYQAEDLAGLKGKRYSGQRNQISQFKRGCDAWEFRPMEKEDIGRVTGFFKEHYLDTASDGAWERKENEGVLEVLEHFDAYGMQGGVLTADGAVAGFSLHEIIGDTMYTHIEKADRRVKGAYQMLVNQAAAAFAGEGVLYINREEDMGDPGLSASKKSYHPLELLKKYVIEIT